MPAVKKTKKKYETQRPCKNCDGKASDHGRAHYPIGMIPRACNNYEPKSKKRAGKRTKLVPADRQRCQVERPVGPFVLGGVIGSMIRCSNKPVVIATEVKPAKDGQRGSMSICTDCLAVFLERTDVPKATFKKIELPTKKALRARKA